VKSSGKITQKKIADMLGVTTVTISKALRDNPDISEKLKTKIKQIAEDLGYRPNILARGLAQRHTRMIGVIVPEITTSFFAEVVEAFYQTAREHQYEVVLMISHEREKDESDNLRYLTALGVDGILISVTRETISGTVINKLINQGVPVVFYDRALEDVQASTVTINDRQGAQSLVQNMINYGCKQIGYLGPLEHPLVVKHRFQGYQDALMANGLNTDKSIIYECQFGKEDAYQTTLDCLKNGCPIDGLFCANDVVALSAYRAITESGYSIPKNIRLAGFGNISENFFLPVPFMTVAQPTFEMGQKALELLLDEIESKEKKLKPRHLVLDSKIIIDNRNQDR
jgi:LacI family transcriptional regulator